MTVNGIGALVDSVFSRGARRKAKLLQKRKELIERSGLFVADNYLKKANSEHLAGYDPLEHFLLFGNSMRIDPHPLFDIDFYLERNPDVEAGRANALVHFLEHGWRERRDPHPLFDLAYVASQNVGTGNPLLAYLRTGGRDVDPCPYFDTRHYLSRLAPADPGGCTPLEHFLAAALDTLQDPHPNFNVAAYLGARPDILPLNPLYHFRRYEQRLQASVPGADPTATLEGYEAAALVRQMAEIEPAVVRAGVDAQYYKKTSPPVVGAEKYTLARNAGLRIGRGPYAAVMLVSFMRRGGAELEAMNILRRMLDADPTARILLLATDPGRHEALDWVVASDRLTFVTFDDLAPTAGEDDRVFVLAHFLVALGAARVINCNSNIGWLAFERYGVRLSRTSRLCAMLFCYDYDAMGARVGYATRFFGGTITRLDAVYVDNAAFRDRLIADFGLPADLAGRVHVVYHPPQPPRRPLAPVEVAQRIRARRLGRPPQVLWAGRPCRQKRVDTLVAVAQLMPGVTFCCAGGTRATFAAQAGDTPPSNMVFLGTYQNFQADLPLATMDAFLHTAGWEGLPNVLVDAVAAGLPVVATDVGGVRELIDDETGWLVPARADAEAYAAAIRAATSDAELVLARLEAARTRLAERHTDAPFRTRLAELGLCPPAIGRADRLALVASS